MPALQQTITPIRSYPVQRGKKGIMLSPQELKEIETVVHAYGQTIAEVCEESAVNYPAFVFPVSLLPYPKKVIEQALQDAVSHIKDEEMLKDLHDVTPYLKNFISDAEAKRKNDNFKLKTPRSFQPGSGPVLASSPVDPSGPRDLFSWLGNNPLVARIKSLLRRTPH
jgi:hypothetical protein